MNITQHGNSKDRFFKGVSVHSGQRLTWFGYNPGHVERKEQEWLEVNLSVSKQRVVQAPYLSLVAVSATGA